MHDAIADLPVAVTALGVPAWAYQDVIVPDRGMLVGIITYKMVIWHPYLGGTKKQAVMIQLKIRAKVDIKIPAPTGPSMPKRWWTSHLFGSASLMMPKATSCRQ
jgi:hypothetical protein